MIGALSARRRIVTINAPVTPTFSSSGPLTSTNTLSGSGGFDFQFNTDKRTCAITVSSSSGSALASLTYFNASDLVDQSDYEVMVSLGAVGGFSNIAVAGGSASFGIWIPLSTSPLYKLSCSDRRGGTRTMTVQIRHRNITAVTASTTLTLNQSSDAVSPVFSGIGGTTSVVRTTTDTFLGVYIDSAQAANTGQIRTYKNTSINTFTGFSFSTGSIPESEYEIATSTTLVTPPGGLIVSSTSGSYVDLSSFRANVAGWDSDTAKFWSRLGTEPSATGRIILNMRHKLDTNKFGQATFDFSTS